MQIEYKCAMITCETTNKLPRFHPIDEKRVTREVNLKFIQLG